jgi:hypothetical protein
MSSAVFSVAVSIAVGEEVGRGKGLGLAARGWSDGSGVCGLLESSGALYEKFTSATTGPGPRATISYGPVRCGRVAARPVGKVHASGVI